MTITKPYPGHN